ncbi:MAG TPA: hypothetical protein VH592_21125 [Gemmataceae bacterium]|jgi:hypothetical protein
MFEAAATDDKGTVIKATGRSEEEAVKRLIAQIERHQGMRFHSFSEGGAVLNFADPPNVAKFREPPPPGNFTAVCFPVGDQIVCVPQCSCADSKHCTCNHSSFSETKSMISTRQPKRRFDDNTPSTDDIIDQLGKAGLDVSKLRGCPPEALMEFWRWANGGEADDFDDADDGLAPNATSNLPANGGALAMHGDRRGKASLSRFSESQRSEFDKVCDYLETNRKALETAGANVQDMKRTFAGAIINQNFTARQLIGHGR